LDDRRLIAELMAGLRAECEAMIDGLLDAAQAPARKDLRALFNGLCTSLALLQAEWPVVEISRNPAGYDQAKQSFNRDDRAFVMWVTTLVTRGG
jgi:hypothetical protein